MKKFDLQAALAGAPCRTRDGRKAFVRHQEDVLFKPPVLNGYVNSITDRAEYVPRSWDLQGRVLNIRNNSSDIVGMWEFEFKHWDLFDPCVVSLTVVGSCMSDSGLFLQAQTRDSSRVYGVHLAAHLITDPVGTVYTR